MRNHEIESYQPLFDGIILQAVSDYRNALKGRAYDGKKGGQIISECERFFRSEYFSMLTKVPGEFLIERLRKEVEGDKE